MKCLYFYKSNANEYPVWFSQQMLVCETKFPLYCSSAKIEFNISNQNPQDI